MLHLEYSLRTEKKNTSAQKHIYHKHMTLQQGETYPALASSHPVQCHAAPVSDLLALVAVQSISEAVEWGRGVSRPCEILGDVNAEELKAAHPLHRCLADGNGCVFSALSPVIPHQLLGLVDVE